MIGVSHPRLGGDRLVAGAGRFVADVRVPGLLEAAVLRSRHAHARLVAVDATRALALPGVRLVLTAADVPENAIIPNRVPVPSGTERYLQPAVARRVVRYVGEPIALVVAEDRYVAEDALELIDVVYEPLPVAATVAAALAADAPRLFVETETNNVAVIRMRVGDADRALAMRPWCCVSASRTPARRPARWRRGAWWRCLPIRAGASSISWARRSASTSTGRSWPPSLEFPRGPFDSPRWTWAAGSGSAASCTPRTSWSRSRPCGRAGPCGGSKVVERA